MITKTKFWMSIRQQLKDMEQSKKFTAAIMQKIKDDHKIKILETYCI